MEKLLIVLAFFVTIIIVKKMHNEYGPTFWVIFVPAGAAVALLVGNIYSNSNNEARDGQLIQQAVPKFQTVDDQILNRLLEEELKSRERN